MVIQNDQPPEAPDIEKNIVTFLEGVNQNTILSQNATVTDKTYTFADTDTFSDSTGYNNTVDSTSGLTYNSELDAFYPSFVLYDDFDDDSLDTGLWTIAVDTGSAAGTASADEQNQQFELASSVAVISGADDNTQSATLTSDNNIEILQFDVITLTVTATGGDADERYESYASVKVGGTVILDKLTNSGSNGTAKFTQTFGDLATGTYILFMDGTTGSLFKDGVFVRTISSLSGAVEFAAFTGQDTEPAGDGGGATCDFFIDDVFLDAGTSGTLTTTTKTFASNIDSILVNGNKTLNGSSTITADISTDGGSVFDKSAQVLDAVTTLDGDDTDVVIRFNLTVIGGGSPLLFGYSYQVWT